jgi:hypothetical protein
MTSFEQLKMQAMLHPKDQFKQTSENLGKYL